MLERIAEGIERINQRIDSVVNFTPGRWLGNEWAYYTKWIRDGQADEYFLVTTIVLIWLLMLGANWPKKWLYWGWLVFWAVKGVASV